MLPGGWAVRVSHCALTAVLHIRFICPDGCTRLWCRRGCPKARLSQKVPAGRLCLYMVREWCRTKGWHTYTYVARKGGTPTHMSPQRVAHLHICWLFSLCYINNTHELKSALPAVCWGNRKINIQNSRQLQITGLGVIHQRCPTKNWLLWPPPMSNIAC